MQRKSRNQSEARDSMTSSRRRGQRQLWDQLGRLRSVLANEINVIFQTLKIHVRIMIIRLLFVYKEGHVQLKFSKFIQKGKSLLYLIEIEFGLMDATKR